MFDGFKVIDGHTHTFSSDEVSQKIIQSFNNVYDIVFENPGTGTIPNVLSNMQQNGIDYTIMANFAPPGILHVNNLWTIDVSREFSSLVPLVSFHPGMQGKLQNLLEGYMNEGAKGVKLHPMAQAFDPANSKLDEVYEYCGETRFPVVFHCGRVSNARLNDYSDLVVLERIIERYPDTPFILTHMADGNVDDVLRTARIYPNVYFDTSIVISGYGPIIENNEPSWPDDDMVVWVVNAVGADRVIFGSDYPWGSPKDDAARILGMKLTDEQKRLIMSENAIRIFRLEDKNPRECINLPV